MRSKKPKKIEKPASERPKRTKSTKQKSPPAKASQVQKSPKRNKPAKRSKLNKETREQRDERLRLEAAARREKRREKWHEEQKERRQKQATTPPVQPPLGAANAMMIRNDEGIAIEAPGAPALPPGWLSPIPPEVNHIDDIGEDGLSYRETLFVEAYLGPARLCEAKAARIAGYTGDSATLHTAGLRMLCRDRVRSRVRARVRACGLEKDDVMDIVKRRATASLARMIDVGLDALGRPTAFVSLIKGIQNGCIDDVVYVREKLGPDGVLERTVKVIDSKPYVEKLWEHHGLNQLPSKAEQDRAAMTASRESMLADLVEGKEPDALKPRAIVVNQQLAPISDLHTAGDAAIVEDAFADEPGPEDEDDGTLGYDAIDEQPQPPAGEPQPAPEDEGGGEPLDALSDPGT